MKGLLYQVSTTDPVAFIVTGALFTLVALAASFIPARRAAKIDPMTALRVGVGRVSKHSRSVNSCALIEQLSAQLDHPETLCSGTSTHCAVFHEACSVSVEIKVVVNEKPQTIVWGSLLESVVSDRPQQVEFETPLCWTVNSGRNQSSGPE